MNTSTKINTLNEHQLEILRLFSREMDDKDFLDIKRLIVKYLADKVTTLADEIWDSKGLKDEDMDRLLNSNSRVSIHSQD